MANKQNDYDDARRRRDADAALMSPEDYEATQRDKALWESADPAGKAAIHARVEQRRAGYGYSGGADGSGYIPLGAAETYGGAAARLAGEVARRKPFSYDPETDPAWRAYREQYARAGRRAADDTLARVSARTGGLASSYAAGAAQQAYGDYMSKLSERLPELYKLAYGMYRDEAADKRADLNALRGLESDADSRGRDARSDAYRERSYADSRADAERARAWKEAETAAKYGDASRLAALGVEVAETASGKSGARGGGKSASGAAQTSARTAQDADDPIDWSSALDLGLGPVSAAQLETLVDAGTVEKYLSGGKWRFRRRDAAKRDMPLYTDRLLARLT